MTKPWPNSQYADGQVSPDPLAFYDPPTQADRVRAHQMVAQSYLSMAAFVGAQAMLWLPSVLETMVALDHNAVTILFGVFCFASGIVSHVISFKLSSKSMFSPHMAAAQKIALGTKPRVRAFDILMALMGAGVCGLVLWLFTPENVPEGALGLAGAAASLSVTGCLIGSAFQQMKRAIDVAMSDVDRPV